MINLKNIIEIKNNELIIKDKDVIKNNMDKIIYNAVFEVDEEKKKSKLLLIKEIAKAYDVVPASIQGLYEEMGRNYPGFTVPAINIRGLTYNVARAIFRRAMTMNVGAMIFEIARSEIGYTNQRPLEYSATILAATVKEGFVGCPIFLQGDHFQLVRKNYLQDKDAETNYVKGLIKEAIEAEFYNQYR